MRAEMCDGHRIIFFWFKSKLECADNVVEFPSI